MQLLLTEMTVDDFGIYWKILECCGNLFDSTVLATKLALTNAKLPKLTVKSDDEGDVSLEVPDDPNSILKINIDNVPNSVSVCKIGHNYVVDADLKEECVVKVKLVFGFDKNGCVRYTSKYGYGSLDPDTIYSMIDVTSIVLFFPLLPCLFISDCCSIVLSLPNLHPKILTTYWFSMAQATNKSHPWNSKLSVFC